MAILNTIRWWEWLPLPFRRWRVVGRVEAGDEVPDRLPSKGVVLVGSTARPTWVAFDCPCRTGHRLMVNLDNLRPPAWRLDAVRPLTIHPSIDDITKGRRCHFLIRGGKVVWALDARRSAS